MYKKRIIAQNKGFTLIEIIASIAILGMIIAVFLPIFPQIVQWTNKADDELIASNLLGQVAYEVKTSGIIEDYTEEITSCEVNDPASITYNYELNGNAYKIKLNICTEVDVALYRTNIQVYTPDERERLSETYTYVQENNAGDSIE